MDSVGLRPQLLKTASDRYALHEISHSEYAKIPISTILDLDTSGQIGGSHPLTDQGGECRQIDVQLFYFCDSLVIISGICDAGVNLLNDRLLVHRCLVCQFVGQGIHGMIRFGYRQGST